MVCKSDSGDNAIQTIISAKCALWASVIIGSVYRNKACERYRLMITNNTLQLDDILIKKKKLPSTTA